VTQLAKDNGKFIYGCIKEGARAREFEEAIEWLVSAGLVLRIYNVSKTEHPIKAYEQLNHFKLFMFDVGLLKHMAGISNESILLKTDYQFSGPLTENYVIQQLQGMYEVEPHYYAPTSQGEIDLILQDGMRIIPGEIKAGNTTRAKAFHHYIAKNQCEKAIRYSGLNYQKNEVICNIPLYMVGKTNELV
jgi:predicted AAA+ superfamily ATPase